MGNTKPSAGRRIFNGILIILDLALLVWIVMAWRGQKKPTSTEEYYSSLGYDVSEFTSSSGGSGDTASGGANSSNDSAEISSGGNADSWLWDSSDEAEDDANEQSFVPLEAAGRPEIGEFDGWDIPAGARAITDYSGITGTWKGFIYYDVAEELVSFSVSGAASSPTLTVDWYLIHYFGDGSWENEEDMEDGVYAGKWTDGVLTAEGTGSFRIDSFYEADGKQYARGELTTPSGTVASVGMMRP
ncbi:MAG: hypothetical protein II889_09775 [Clostridia bacterium]|nr:hypothetical protein [Clostridia bacterium]